MRTSKPVASAPRSDKPLCRMEHLEQRRGQITPAGKDTFEFRSAIEQSLGIDRVEVWRYVVGQREWLEQLR